MAALVATPAIATEVDTRSRRLGPEQRKEDDVADGRRVREHHDESVDSHAEAGRRGHPVLERADVVLVEVHRFFVAARLLLDLRAKARGLIVGVVQLAERVAELSPVNEELEAVGELGLASLRRASGETSNG